MSTINLANGNTLLSTGAFPPVRAASTGSPLNPATGGLLTVDGITLTVGDRVLVKDESSAINNGIYAAQTGPWIRTSDAQSNTQLFPGMTVTVGPGGAVNAGKTYVCTCTDDPVNVGTSQITWAAQSDVQTAQQTATSTTSLTIGTGSQPLTIQAGKAFKANQEVLIYETSNTANSMLGSITSYSGTSLVVNVTNTAGSGTHADWTVVLYGSVAAAGITPPIGVGNVTGPGSSTTGHLATFADGTGKVLQDSGVTLGSLASLSSITAQFLASSALAAAVPMLNGTLVSSVAANALTVALKTLAGADPSSSDPVFFLIPNGTGGYTVIKQTAALSITVPTGATVGTSNAQANRIWVAAFNNAGAPVLGVYNSLSGNNVLCWDETSTSVGNLLQAGSNSAQTWYTASALAATNFRVIGFVESTQATAGTWATSPSKTMLYGPGVARPGTVLQEIPVSPSSDTFSTASFVAATNNRIPISMISSANLVFVQMMGALLYVSGTNPQWNVRWSRGTTNNTNLIGSANLNVVATGETGVSSGVMAYDVPNSASVTYAVQGLTSSGSVTLGTTQLLAREIQI